MQLTLTLALDVLRGRFDEGVSDMFSAMCAWVLFANLQANLSPFRCIPHYVTQRDVERNNCSLEPVGYRHFPRPYVSTRGCGYARLDKDSLVPRPRFPTAAGGLHHRYVPLST